jgi:molecular chaperone DnaK (HSP70)
MVGIGIDFGTSNSLVAKFSEDNKQENQNNSTEKKPQESVKKTVSLEESLKKLNMLVGLENVKRTINEWIETFTLSKKTVSSSMSARPPISEKEPDNTER